MGLFFDPGECMGSRAVVSYHCRAVACRESMSEPRLFCRRHWSMVPEYLQHQLISRYLPGQFDLGFAKPQATPEFAVFAVRAVCAIGLKERMITQMEADRRIGQAEEVVRRHRERRDRGESGW